MIKPFAQIRCLLTAVVLIASPSFAEDQPVQTQAMITDRVTQNSPITEAFIKDRPILGWQLTSDQFEDIPDAIRENLGAVDDTGYDQTYLADNIGSIIALQFQKDGPDFYIIGKDTYDGKYTQVPLDEIAAKNTRLVERLDMTPDVKALYDDRAKGLVGALKTTPVDMIRASALGYAVDDALTIQAPWGEQNKPAGADAFLVWDDGEDQYYMVNAGEDGLPLSYVPAK